MRDGARAPLRRGRLSVRRPRRPRRRRGRRRRLPRGRESLGFPLRSPGAHVSPDRALRARRAGAVGGQAVPGGAAAAAGAPLAAGRAGGTGGRIVSLLAEDRVASGTDLDGQWDALADRCGGGPFVRPGWIGAWRAAFGTGAAET